MLLGADINLSATVWSAADRITKPTLRGQCGVVRFHPVLNYTPSHGLNCNRNTAYGYPTRPWWMQRHNMSHLHVNTVVSTRTFCKFNPRIYKKEVLSRQWVKMGPSPSEPQPFEYQTRDICMMFAMAPKKRKLPKTFGCQARVLRNVCIVISAAVSFTKVFMTFVPKKHILFIYI